MSIRVTHEELTFLCRMMGHPALRGLPLLLSPNNPAEEQRLLMAAENSLRARGLLIVESDQISVDTTVMNVLAFLMTAPVAVGLRRTRVGFTPEVHMLFASPDLQLQVSVDRGLYTVDAAPANAWEGVFRLLPDTQLSERPGRLPVERIPSVGLVQVGATSQITGASRQDLVTALNSQGAYFPEAEWLFDFYRNDWLSTINIGVWISTDVNDPAMQSNLTLLEARNGYWRLDQHDGNQVTLWPLRADQVHGFIENMEQSVRHILIDQHVSG